MTKIQESVNDNTRFFNVNGLDYPKGQYIYKYRNEIISGGNTDTTVIEIAIVDKYTGELLISYSRVEDYVNAFDVEYNSLELLLIDLGILLGINSEEIELGNYIPLTGTEVDNPVTGDIEIIKQTDQLVMGLVCNDIDIDNQRYIGFGDDGTVVLKNINTSTGDEVSLSVDPANIIFGSSLPSSRGISGSSDFTPNITDLDYTQKIYVDTKQPKFYSFKLAAPSIYATGTTAEVELVKITIPANTFSANDIIKIPNIIFNKLGTANAVAVRLKMSTSSTMPMGLTGQIGQITIGATSLYSQGVRTFIVNGGNLKGYSFTTAALTDIVPLATAISSVVFDVTQTQYFYISAALLNASDSLRVDCLQITNY
jgi:hypothetical protein